MILNLEKIIKTSGSLRKTNACVNESAIARSDRRLSSRNLFCADESGTPSAVTHPMCRGIKGKGQRAQSHIFKTRDVDNLRRFSWNFVGYTCLLKSQHFPKNAHRAFHDSHCQRSACPFPEPHPQGKYGLEIKKIQHKPVSGLF